MQEFLNFLKTESIISSADVLVSSHKPLRYETYLKEIRWLSSVVTKFTLFWTLNDAIYWSKVASAAPPEPFEKYRCILKYWKLHRKPSLSQRTQLPKLVYSQMLTYWQIVWAPCEIMFLSKEKVTSQLRQHFLPWRLGLGCLWLLFETMIEFLQEEMYYLLPNIWCIWASLRPHGFEMSKV